MDYVGKNGGNLGGDKNGFLPFTGARWQRYGQSKLANVAFCHALHDRIAAAGYVDSASVFVQCGVWSCMRVLLHEKSVVLLVPGAEPSHPNTTERVYAQCVLLNRADSPSANIKSLVAHPGLSATNLQVKNAGEGVGHFGYKMLMKLAQSCEDGTSGIFRCTCDPEVESRQLYGPAKITGEAVLNDPATDIKKLPAPVLNEFWRASCDATGVTFFPEDPQ